MTPHASQEGTPRTDEQVDDPYSIHLMNDRAERHDEAGRQRFGLTLCKEVVPADFARTLELENQSLQRRLGEAEGLLQGIIDGCVHPDKAVRRMSVDLEPIRSHLARRSAP